MAGLTNPTFDLATIAGVSCHTPAWQLTNSHVLRDPAPRRRDNVKLAGVDGVLGRRSLGESRTVGLEFWVVGEVTRTGSANANALSGVEANIAYLRTNVYRATEDTYGTVSCSVVGASGATYSGRIQLDDFVVQPGIGARWVFIQATLVAGELTGGS